MKKILISFAVITIFFLTIFSSAYAYTFNGGKHQGPVIPYKWGTFTNTPNKWRTAFLDANYSWNYAVSKVQWGYNSSNTYSIEQVYYLENSTQYGRFQGLYNATTKLWSRAWSELNQFALETNGEKDAKFKQSTACHEEGHSLGLDHSTAVCIMNPNRDRLFYFNPQTDDINGVNARY